MRRPPHHPVTAVTAVTALVCLCVTAPLFAGGWDLYIADPGAEDGPSATDRRVVKTKDVGGSGL